MFLMIKLDIGITAHLSVMSLSEVTIHISSSVVNDGNVTEVSYFANKGSSSQGYGFSCGHVWM